MLKLKRNVKTLHSLLGLVNHYNGFCLKFKFMHLNNPLKKDIIWDWSDACLSAKVKSLLSSNLLLAHYDPPMDIVIVSDASKYGVEAVISHFFLMAAKSLYIYIYIYIYIYH